MAISRMTAIVAVTLLLTVFNDSTEGQSPANAPSYAPSYAPSPTAGPDCFTNLLNMTDCLTFVEAGSNLTVPDKPCCGELAGLVESNPICLCEMLGSSDTFGIKIDLQQALKLPTVCGVETPPVSTCTLLGIPVGVPTASETPTLSPGSEPSSGGGKDGNGVSSIIADSSLTFVIGLSIAFILSFF